MNKEKFNNFFATTPYPLQDKTEFLWLVDKAQRLSPLKTIIEVGFDKGGSLKFWNEIIEPKGLLIGIDVHNLLEWKQDKKVIILTGGSQDTLPVIVNLEGQLADFIFLDGCHDEMIYKDYRNYLPLVRKGGILAFHDCGEVSINYAEYHKVPKEETSTQWFRGGAPHVKKCFESIQGKRRERLQVDQGMGIVYV